MSDSGTTPSEQTHQAEEEEARAAHEADRMPTPEEEAAAPTGDDLDPEVAEDFQEMTERGANVKGEGEIP